MTRDDAYLWDRSGEPDPEIEGLEEALGRYRYRHPRRRRFWPVLLAVAAVLVAGLMVLLRPPPTTDGWEVRWAGGRSGTLAVGEWLDTDERARIAVADIGTVDIEPRSRVRLVRTDDTQHRLELERGKLHALVTAPPRLFVVDTPEATAVDLGCEYTLQVDAKGDGLLEVLLGYVQLERTGAPAAYVPWGARCRIHAGKGPGVPYFNDAPSVLRDLDPVNLPAAFTAGDVRDTLTLWHLLPLVRDPGELCDAITELVPLPAGVTRERIVALDNSALLAFREALELHW